ncbi:HdeD family acid-resistance protein [Agrobacterium tumefaciens]|uniref:HdeD family acid-resistance protein n=1 Tax=Agrobacterium tumefaciens TaxID=358 RepID=UPI001CBC5FF5|nr:DUF4105 domain-containing protein [Agrobacterium tumefaciens]
MIQLLFLLLGPVALKPVWRTLTVAGVIWMLFGVAILFDLSDGRLWILLDTLALLLAIEGLVEFLAALSSGIRRYWIDAARGVAFLLAAFLVLNVPWDGNIGAAIVFGTAFLIDGLFRIGSALTVHSSRWRIGIVAGAIEILLAVAILASWPVPHLLTVPFCFALLLLTSGYALVRLAVPLRDLPEGGSVMALPLYSARNWQGGTIPAVIGPVEDRWNSEREELNVLVWTATGSIADPDRRILIDRYIAAVDKNGVISTGHAALEMPPDIYVSHYPANDIDHNPDDFRALLSAGHENDVAGRFNVSLEQEAAAWCMPDQKVTFHRFRPEAVRHFWTLYSRDNTYNLTARNCSTTVIQVLDAATEGASSKGRLLRDLIVLLSNPQFWLLRVVRGRAEAMTWTPGLVLDYARLLHEIVDNGEQRWRRKIRNARQTRKVFEHREEQAEHKEKAR